MSYGPIWYEWSKREATDSDSYEMVGEGNTHTRYGLGNVPVTEVFWCQPGGYHGAPSFTDTKYRKLIATIYCTPYCTNDESANRVFIRSFGFIEHRVLQQAVEFAVSDSTTPGTDQTRLASSPEYVPGQDYPCIWCGRTADKECRGYYDPTCVDVQGNQHSVYSRMHEFDNRCHATRCDVLIRKDGTKEDGVHSRNCYKGRNHEGEHQGVGWNKEIWPVQSPGPWISPSEDELAAARKKLLEDSLNTIERCRNGEIDAHGRPIK